MLYSDALIVLTVSFLATQPQVMVAILILAKVPSDRTRTNGVWKPEFVNEVILDRITVSHHPRNGVAVVDYTAAKAVDICLVYINSRISLGPVEGHVTVRARSSHVDFPWIHELALVSRLVVPPELSALAYVLGNLLDIWI